MEKYTPQRLYTGLGRLHTALVFALTVFLFACGKDEPSAQAQQADSVDVKYALIIGTGVNVRSGAGVSYPVVFQLDQGDQVQVLDSAYSQDQEGKPVELILTKPLKVNADGRKVTLAKGSAVTSIAAGDPGGDLLVITFQLDGKTYADSAVYIEDIRAERISDKPWYHIKTDEEKEGWVYSEFVTD